MLAQIADLRLCDLMYLRRMSLHTYVPAPLCHRSNLQVQKKEVKARIELSTKAFTNSPLLDLLRIFPEKIQ